MSKSGQAYVAATEGHQFTLYATMRKMGIPLTKEQAEFQAYLERTYPAIVLKEEADEVHCHRCHWKGCKHQLSAEFGCPTCLSNEWLEYKE